MATDVDHLKQQARAPDTATRAFVAASREAPPELLYFLTTDADETVRATAAENEATPLQATPVLQLDESARVRAALSRKLVRVLPSLTDTTKQMAMDSLLALCRDTALEVRTALVSTLQNGAYLPPEMARILANDSAREVAGPVLRFCLSLSDDELAHLIKTARQEWVPVEVAHRPQLSNNVAAAIWESANVEAAEIMLGNTQAEVGKPVLDEATEEAAVEVTLQRPLVQRPELDAAQVGRLAQFVDGSLLETLAARADLVKPELAEVSRLVRRRLDWVKVRDKTPDEIKRAEDLHKQNALDEAAITDAIAWGERAFVTAALALRARTPYAMAEKIIAHQSPKGITALCFKAGLSMRTARLIQIRTAKLPPLKALLAKGGIDYPLSMEEIRWQWEFYGLA